MISLPKRPLTPSDRKAKVWFETRIHHRDSGLYSAEIGFIVDGAFKSITVATSLMHEPGTLRKELLNAGAKKDQISKDVLEALADAQPISEIQLTNRCGWIDDTTYVQPRWSLGLHAKEVRANCPVDARDSHLGSPDKWKKGLALPCRASSILSFAIGTAFAAPLLNVIGEDEGVTFNLHGKSSAGKSLACRAALSVSVRAKKNETPTYDITPTGLEEHCFLRNDSLIVVDEEGLAGEGRPKREIIKKIAFKVAGGQGKIRSEFATKTMQSSTANWRAFGLTTGEHPLDELISKRDAGEQVRHVDIPVTSRNGIFDRSKALPEPTKADALAKQVEAVISSNYGCCLKLYIERLLGSNRELLERETNAIVSAFKAKVLKSDNSWEQRFAGKFGLVLAGMLAAVRFRVAPWTEKHARRCVMKLYRVARNALSTTPELAKKLLGDIKKRKAAGDLPRLDEGSSYKGKSQGVFGIRRKHKRYGEIVAIDAKRLAAYFGSEDKLKAVHEWLIAQKKAPDCQPKRRLQLSTGGLPGKARRRWIVLDASTLRVQ